MQSQSSLHFISTNSIYSPHFHKDISNISNRVNYILRKHRKVNEEFHTTHIEMANNSNNKEFIKKNPQQKQQRKPYISPRNKKDRQFCSLPKDIARQIQNMASTRKIENIKNYKLIKQQKQQSFLSNRVKRLKVVKSQRTGRQKVRKFWQQRKKDFEKERAQRNVPQLMSSIKADDLRMRILIIEEQSLSQFQKLICHQEHLAKKIKEKLCVN